MSHELPDKKPCWVRCGKCEHVWIAFYLPMLVKLMQRYKNMTCPMCASRKIFLAPKERIPAKPTESSLGEGPNALSNEGEISKPKSEFKKRGAGHGN